MSRLLSHDNMMECPHCKDKTEEVAHMIWEVNATYLETECYCKTCHEIWYTTYFPEASYNGPEDPILDGP